MAEVKAAEKIAESWEEIEASIESTIETKVIEGFKPGTKILIGSISAGVMIAWGEANEGAKRTAGLRLIMESLVNSAGVRYARNPEYLAQLRRISYKVTDRIVDEITEFNGMNPKVEATVKKD